MQRSKSINVATFITAAVLFAGKRLSTVSLLGDGFFHQNCDPTLHYIFTHGFFKKKPTNRVSALFLFNATELNLHNTLLFV